MRDLAPIHKQLLMIERDFPVDQLRCGEHAVWPIIRCQIAGKLFSNELKDARINGEILNSQGSGPGPEGEFRNLVDSLTQQLTNLPAERSIRASFFTFFFEYTELNGLRYNKWLDPLKEILLDQKINYIDIDCGNYPEQAPKQVFPNMNINSILEAAKTLAPYAGQIHGLDSLFKYLNTVGIHVGLGYADLEKEVSQIMAMQRVLAILLAHYSPTACFFVCFYHSIGYAICGACAQLGIRSVDIQHGIVEDIDPFYGTWSKIPEQGYTYLPSHIWSWGQKSKETIESWNCPAARHSAIVGGNPWLGKARELEPGLGASRPKHTTNPTLLVTCCRSPYEQIIDILPLALRESIQSGPKNWRWIIRLHYKMDKVTRDLIRDYFAPWSENVTVQDPEGVNLYDLFKNATFHLTMVSTTALEAEALQIPNIIMGQVGYGHFKEEIEKGWYLYANNGIELINHVQNDPPLRERTHKIMETDRSLTTKVLLEMISR